MKSLVTGANGFVGSHVARRLIAAGDSVRVLTRPQCQTAALTGLDVECVEGDLRDASSLARAVDAVDRVFHVAADYRLWSRNPQEIYESNVTGTRNLLDASLRAGVSRFIYTGTVATVAVDRPQHPDERTESQLAEMIGHYKRSKWLAEQEILKAAKSGAPVVIAMPTTPVGPGDWKPTPTGKLIVDFLKGQMPGYVDTGLNFVAVEDVAEGHLLVAEKGKIGERYLLGAENFTLKQLLDCLASITGKRPPRLKIPHAVALGFAYAENTFSRFVGRTPQIPVEGVKIARHFMFVECSRASRELGFAPGPVRGALERAVAWYEANGYVPARRGDRVAQATAA